jgi:hypothetical protein
VRAKGGERAKKEELQRTRRETFRHRFSTQRVLKDAVVRHPHSLAILFPHKLRPHFLTPKATKGGERLLKAPLGLLGEERAQSEYASHVV